MDSNYQSITSVRGGEILIGIPSHSVRQRDQQYQLLIFNKSSDVQAVTVQSFLRQHALSGEYSDVCIRIGTASFPVHRLVLSRFPYSQAMFHHGGFKMSCVLWHVL